MKDMNEMEYFAEENKPHQRPYIGFTVCGDVLRPTCRTKSQRKVR
jgi:hypothetical protein